MNYPPELDKFTATWPPNYDEMRRQYKAVPMPLINTPPEQTRTYVLKQWQAAILANTGRLVKLSSLLWQTSEAARKRRPRKQNKP